MAASAEAIPCRCCGPLARARRELPDAEQHVEAASAERGRMRRLASQKADEVERRRLGALSAVDVRLTQLRTRAEAALRRARRDQRTALATGAARARATRAT